MGPGGGTGTNATPYTGDTSQLPSFLQTAAGKQYASQYQSGQTYLQEGDALMAYDVGSNKPQQLVPGNANSPYYLPNNVQTGTNVSAMFAAYQTWLNGNQQTQANWQNYADTVAANEGGQGDNTITTGTAVGQRQQLLGALSNVGQPTAPTPGLGSMGMIK